VRALKTVILAVVAVAALAVGGTFVYFHFIGDDAPAELKLEDDKATGTPVPDAPGVDLSGTWVAGEGSVGRYRVKEVAFGQRKTAVGETNAITGDLVLDGSTVRQTTVEVDMATVKSDSDKRDSQFQGRIMDVEHFPKATFALAERIELDSMPPIGKVVAARAKGDLTLRGTTKRVDVTLKAKRSADSITVQGSVPIAFAEWNIPNPSFGPISTEDNGSLEFLVVYRKA
jgi:polyisoprenoid-binding protein YceI